jgi:hypothetical protein
LTEAPIVVENREEIIFLLTEASELEHMLMLQYLFAAFSLKTDAGEGLTEETTLTSACFCASWLSTSSSRGGIRISSRRDR